MTQVISEEIAKAKAKALREKLNALGFPIKHSQALEVVAALENETGWSSLNAKQNKVRPHAAPVSAPTTLVDDEEPIDPALAEFDYPYGVEFTMNNPGEPPKLIQVVPAALVKGAVALRNRTENRRSLHNVTARVCVKDKKGGWEYLTEEQIAQAIAWETRHDKKEGV